MSNSAKTLSAADKNPCHKCRSMKLPTCTCKGQSGGGDSGSTSGETSKQKEDKALPSSPNQPNSGMQSHLLGSEHWKEASWLQGVLEFNKPDALFSATLDPEQGLLKLEGKPNLSPEKQAELDQFFDKISAEFMQFKQELKKKGEPVDRCIIDTTKEGSITIRIPSKHFDAFIMQLINKHLLPTKANMPNQTPAAIEPEEREISRPRHRSPFDLRSPARTA